MNWNLFVTELVAGITHGSVYALIALGYSMVYGILKLLNFAHGDIYMVGAFIGYGMIIVFGGAHERSRSTSCCCSSLMFLCAMLGGRAARRDDRALRLPEAAQRAANRAAHHRARRLVLPRERARSSCSARSSRATTAISWPNSAICAEGLHASRPGARRLRADHRRRRDDRSDDRADALRAAHADRQGDARDLVRP